MKPINIIKAKRREILWSRKEQEIVLQCNLITASLESEGPTIPCLSLAQDDAEFSLSASDMILGCSSPWFSGFLHRKFGSHYKQTSGVMKLRRNRTYLKSKFPDDESSTSAPEASPNSHCKRFNLCKLEWAVGRPDSVSPFSILSFSKPAAADETAKIIS